MKNNRILSLITALPMCFSAVMNSSVSMNAEAESIRYEYGVFLGADSEDLDNMTDYRKIVLDAQCFSDEQIKELKDSGHIVYSYINIGSVEEYRDYYQDYTKFALGEYVNWEDEVWVDVSQKEWQKFVVDKLAKEILDKGVDGLWVDNCDVYYNFKTNDIYNGLTDILKGLKKYDTYVVINGGDTYISRYARKNNGLDGIMDAVNQESVFSSIDWEHDKKFIVSSDEDKDYFQKYCELVSSCGKDVYLLEYTKNDDIIADVKEYCAEKGYTYYASSTLDLLAPGQKKGSQPLAELPADNTDEGTDTDAPKLPDLPGNDNYADAFTPGIWSFIEDGTRLEKYVYIDPNGHDFTAIFPDNDLMMKGTYSTENGVFKANYNNGPSPEGEVTIWKDRAVIESDGILYTMSYCSDSTPETFDFLNDAEVTELVSGYFTAVTGKAMTPDDITIEDESFYAAVCLNDGSEYNVLCYVDRITGKCTDMEDNEIDMQKYAQKEEDFTVEDAELFVSFLHGKKCDLKGRNFDLNNDGIWNTFDLIEMRKHISK